MRRLISNIKARYYDRLLLEKEYQLDAQEIAEYFPLQSTIDGMLNIFEKIFGLEFVQITDKKDLEGVTWHEDTKLYQVWNDKPEDGFVGYLYLDLHPREGKYGHAANFRVQSGFTKKDGSRHYPATALVCNFSKPTNDKPSLLKHQEVVGSSQKQIDASYTEHNRLPSSMSLVMVSIVLLALQNIPASMEPLWSGISSKHLPKCLRTGAGPMQNLHPSHRITPLATKSLPNSSTPSSEPSTSMMHCITFASFTLLYSI